LRQLYLDDSKDDSAQVNGEQQQLAGQKVPDPSDQPVLLRNDATEARSTLLGHFSAG